MADNLDKLYGAVSAKFDIGDAEAFKAKMQTPEDRKKFYDVVSGKGFDLGDYNSYETRLGGTTSVQKKSPIQTGGENSTVVTEQVTQPSKTNGYEWSSGIKTPLSGEAEQATQASNVNPVTGTKGNPYDYIFSNQKKATEHLQTADAAGMDINYILKNEKVKTAQDLYTQIQQAPDGKTKKELTAKYEEFLKQPAAIDNGMDWEGSVNGRKVNTDDPLKGKTVGDAVEMVKAKQDEKNKSIDAYKNTRAETNDVIQKMRTAVGYSPDPDKGYKELDAVHNFFGSAGKTIDGMLTGAQYMLADETGRKQILKQKMMDQELYPEQAKDDNLTHISGMVGGIIPYVGLGYAGGVVGTPGVFLANSLGMGLTGYSNAAQEAYAEKFKETGNEDEAFKTAETMSRIGAGVGAAQGAALSLMPGGKLPTSVRDFIFKTGQKNAVLGGMFSGSRFLENKLAQMEGLDRESMSGVKESFVDGMLLGTVMDGLHYFPGKIGDATKGRFENILARYSFADVTQAVDNAVQAGVMDNASAQKVMAPIQEKAAAFSKMPDTMPFEKQETVLPLMVERNRLAAEKEKTAEAFHGGIDAKIEDIDRRIAEQSGSPLTSKERMDFEKLQKRKGDPEDKLTSSESDLHDHYAAREKSNFAVNNIDETPQRVTYKDGRTGLLHKNSEGDIEFTPDGNSKSVVFDKGGSVNEKSIKQLGFTVESKNELARPNSQIVSGEVKIGGEVIYKGKRYSITENKNAPEGFKADADGNVRLLYLKDENGQRIVVGADNADGVSLIADANKLIGKQETKPEVSLQEPVESKLKEKIAPVAEEVVAAKDGNSEADKKNRVEHDEKYKVGNEDEAWSLKEKIKSLREADGSVKDENLQEFRDLNKKLNELQVENLLPSRKSELIDLANSGDKEAQDYLDKNKVKWKESSDPVVEKETPVENVAEGGVESKKADIEKRRQEELVALLPQNKTPIHSLDFSTAFNIGIPEFYQQMFDMAKQGKDTIAGVKEKNATLLKKLYNEGKLRDKKDVWLALNPKAAEINAKYDAELTALGEPAPPAAEEVVAKEDGNVEVVKEEEAVSEGGREAQSDGKYKRLVEPSKPIDKMNSQELYDLAVENKKALKEQDREFAGKTEKEKEDGGYYDSIDDVADLRDASEKISWIESSKDADEVAKNIRSTVAKMDKNNISEYDLAIINAATLKAEEFGINQNDFIGKVVKAEFERHANIEDAKFMAKALREKIGNAKEKPELPVSKEPVAEKKKTIKEAKEEHKVFKEQILAAEPTTPRQFIMQWFAGGGKMKTAEFKKETGFSKGEEFRKRIWAHTNKEYFMRDRKGMRVGDEVKPYSLDDIIALVQEEWATNHGGELDYQDVRNEVIDVLQSHNSPSEMIENLREDFADKEGNIIADKYDRAAMRNEEAQEAMGVFENADKHAEDEKALAAVEKIDELELDEKDISSIEKFVSKFTDANGKTDWAKAAEAVEDVFNEAYGELTKNAAKQIEKIIADGKAKNEPGRKGENLPEDTGNKGDNGGQDKVSESEKIIREEYSQKLADADAKIEAAKQAKQSDVNAINKRANLFGGDTGAEKNKGLFGAQKDDYAQIEKITAEHDKKIAEAEIAKQKLVDEQDKAIKNAVDLEKRQQKLELGKDKLADGLDDLINIIGGGPKFFVAPENKPKVIDALAKIGRGLMDIGEAKIDDVIEKIKAYVLSKSRNITEEDVEELKGEILDKINIETISEEPINAKNIDKAVAKKLKEETREAGRDLIRKRRASIDSENLKTELYAQSLEKQTTKEQREVLPFILEKTNVPEKLGRPDLVETLKNDKAKLEPIAAQIREHFDKMWEKIVANTENLDADQIKDYVTHIWDIPKDKTEQVANWFSTKNRFLNKRYISTIEEGVDLFGLKPKVLDIAQIIRIHDSVANTVIANGEFVTDLKTMSRDGMPLIIRADKSPEGWVTVDHPAMSSPLVIPGENGKANVVIKLPYKVHPDLAESVKAIFGKKIDSKFLDNYMKVDGVMKKIGLSVSLFHHGALSETAIALMGPVKAVTAIGKLGKAAIVNKFEGTPLAQFPNEAVDAIKHGVKFGHTLDINTGAVNGILEKIASKTKDIPVAGKAAELLSSFNEKWDTGLWNYLHDGLKLYAFMDAKTKMPENTANPKKYLQEHAQLINDYFGGQNWDVLLTSPRAQQIVRLALLSPDWTISKLRLAGAPVGLGAMSKDAKYVRAKASGMFWVKAAIYYGVGLNLMNAYFRKQDRKEHPEYYPEGNNSFMDNTMFGNTVGHKTHLFTGRYEDGSEMYRRWGKEFRELPELFMNEDGVSFPKPLLEKAGGKMAPAAQIVSKLMTGNSLGGYEDWDLKDKKGWAWTAGAMKVIAKGYTPMSTGNFFRDDKEWKPADLMFPGGKGMTKSKTIDLFKKGIDQGDEAYVKEIYSGAVRNNLDAYGLFKTAIQSSNAEKTKELMQGIKTVDDVKQKIRDTTDKEEKQKLFRKLRKFEIENKQKHQANKLWKEAEKELRD